MKYVAIVIFLLFGMWLGLLCVTRYMIDEQVPVEHLVPMGTLDVGELCKSDGVIWYTDTACE